MKLEEIVSKEKYKLPFKPNRGIKRCPSSSHKKLGLDNCIDWGMPIGTPILAAKDGVVIKTESRFNKSGNMRYYYKANGVYIKHDNGEVSIYGHLMWRGVVIKKGQKVKAGQLIGYSGQTGFTTYPHLHFGVYKLIKNDYVNIKVKF